VWDKFDVTEDEQETFRQAVEDRDLIAVELD